MVEHIWAGGLSPAPSSPDKLTIPKKVIHILVWISSFDNMSDPKKGGDNPFYYMFQVVYLCYMNARDMFEYYVNRIGEHSICIDIRFMDEDMITLYFEKPKRVWGRKPIMPNTWIVVDSKVHNSFMYIEGLCTPMEIQRWGVEEVTKYLSSISKEVVPNSDDDITNDD